ncbi:MAG: orotate phosphoribosyltransferase [Aggregatilineales bacterium]
MAFEDNKHDVARALLEIDAVGFTPQSPIRFKSGILSPVYVDNRRLPFHPRQWHTVIVGFAELIENTDLSFDVIAGVAVGGVPHSSALAYHTGRPSLFVRKEAKGHGKGQRVEGGEVAHKRVLLVEDLVTTGGSSLSGIEALRQEGANVERCLAIVSYGFVEAQTAFASAGITLHTLTDFTTILDVAIDMKKFSSEQKRVVQDWFDDPYGWEKRQGLG